MHRLSRGSLQYTHQEELDELRSQLKVEEQAEDLRKEQAVNKMEERNREHPLLEAGVK